jgi:hypothetical protein
MKLINVQGNIYNGTTLVGAPGTDYLKAKRYGNTNTIQLVIVAAAHAGSDDIELSSCDYRSVSVNGTKYTTPDDAVTGINTMLEAALTLPSGVVLPEGLTLPAKIVASNVQAFGASEDGDLYLQGSDVKYNTP